MNDTQIKRLITEIRREQHISPFEEEEVLLGYIKEAEYDINKSSGAEIDYEKDLRARSLLKNYVLYSRFSRLAEVKQLYANVKVKVTEEGVIIKNDNLFIDTSAYIFEILNLYLMICLYH